MYCSSLQWIPAGGIILSLAHIVKDIVHPTIDIYGFVPRISSPTDPHSSSNRLYQALYLHSE
jgi:hypothetical protein